MKKSAPIDMGWRYRAACVLVGILLFGRGDTAVAAPVTVSQRRV